MKLIYLPNYVQNYPFFSTTRDKTHSGKKLRISRVFLTNYNVLEKSFSKVTIEPAPYYVQVSYTYNYFFFRVFFFAVCFTDLPRASGCTNLM